MYPGKPDSNLGFRNVQLFTSHDEVTLILKMRTTKKEISKAETNLDKKKRRAEAS